jgi:hypothetical protein
MAVRGLQVPPPVRRRRRCQAPARKILAHTAIDCVPNGLTPFAAQPHGATVGQGDDPGTSAGGADDAIFGPRHESRCLGADPASAIIAKNSGA